MILADYHLHTSFSSDSESSMEEMIRHAVSLGLKLFVLQSITILIILLLLMDLISF